jgi:uncharacterized phosphosugar-binding protein
MITETALTRYGAQLQAMLARAFTEQAEALENAAQRIADAMARGGLLYTFGTGHAHLLAEELFYRAGGLVRVCPMLDERLMLHLSASRSTDWERQAGVAAEVLARYPVGENDVLLVISNSGRNTAPVEMALLAKARGAQVIALTNLAHSQGATPRNPHGKRLFEVAGLVLDNAGIPGDALLPRRDGSRVGPTSTAIGAALLQAVVCRVAELADAAGAALDCFASSNIDGGDAVNAGYIARYHDRIPHL